MEKIKVSETLGSVPLLVNQADKPGFVLILAHGAGAPMTHPFMENLALGIAERGGLAVRFNFPYIEQGSRSPKSPGAAIEAVGAVFRATRSAYPELPVFLSGKSYGGRMSSHWMAENPKEEVAGIIYYGFPLHAPGRDGKSRADHLANIHKPQLFIQGTNDKLANYQLIREVVAAQIDARLFTIEMADHSFKVPKKSGNTNDQVLVSLAEETTNWINDKT